MIENTPDVPGLEGLIFPAILSVSFGFVAHLLAKEKGRNVLKWTIIGFIPFINFGAMWFFVGASNLKLERKMDTIIDELKNKTPSFNKEPND